jgi:glutaredoxin-like protein NrdH
MSEIKLYGLTTCPHCKRVLEFLERSNAEFDVLWLDELEGEEKEKAIKEVYRISGSYAVPLVVKGEKWVLGYNPEKLRELLG